MAYYHRSHWLEALKGKRMSTSNTLTTDFTLRLHDGRAIGVASVGKSDGFPIFHCHGSGSSRLEVNLLAAAATAQGVRLTGLASSGLRLKGSLPVDLMPLPVHTKSRTGSWPAA